MLYNYLSFMFLMYSILTIPLPVLYIYIYNIYLYTCMPNSRKCFIVLTSQNGGGIVHELGHALGSYHEHMRPKRNDYVIIEPYRLEMPHNYGIINNSLTFGIPYDFSSIMHYGRAVGIIQLIYYMYYYISTTSCQVCF